MGTKLPKGVITSTLPKKAVKIIAKQIVRILKKTGGQN